MNFYRGLRPFVVQYHGYYDAFDDKGGQEDNDNPDKKPKKYQRLKLENLLYKEMNKDPYSYLDLKMGTDTVLRSPTSSSYQKFVKRDHDTTSAMYGFRLIGYNLYSKSDGKPFVSEHIVEEYDKTGSYDFVKYVFTQMLTDYEGRKAPHAVFDLLLEKITALKEFLGTIQGSRRLVNSSLFMLFDKELFTRINNGEKIEGGVEFKMIDIGEMRQLEEHQTHDIGYLKGLEELIKLLNYIKLTD